MSQVDTTSWRLIEGAAAGQASDRQEFARRYEPAVRTYLAARWRGSPLEPELSDAIQDVFVECFRTDGVLAKADRTRAGGFRPLLFGVLRNVARRYEQRRGSERADGAVPLSAWEGMEDRGETPSVLFDRAWAQAVMREAAALHQAKAHAAGAAATRRFELLRLRFHQGLPIREIAQLWQADPAELHHQYATARREFEAALREVVALRYAGSAEQTAQVLHELLAALG